MAKVKIVLEIDTTILRNVFDEAMSKDLDTFMKTTTALGACMGNLMQAPFGEEVLELTKHTLKKELGISVIERSSLHSEKTETGDKNNAIPGNFKWPMDGGNKSN